MPTSPGTEWQTLPQATVEEASRSDGKIHGLWLIAALTSYLIWSGFVVVLWLRNISESSDLGFVLELLGVIGFLASGFTSYLIYGVVDRCNKHFARTELLYWNSLESVEAATGRSDVLIPLRSAQESVARLAYVQHQRSAVLWALLCMIPIVGWVFLISILWLTSKGFRRHAQLEGPVIEDLDRTLRATGSQGIAAGTVIPPYRDALGYFLIIILILESVSSFLIGFDGYLVLGFLTLGGVSLLWLDLAISDPLPHFRNHPQLEGSITSSVLRQNVTTTGVP